MKLEFENTFKINRAASTKGKAVAFKPPVNYLKDKKGDAAYLQIVGPCQLASEDEELAGHSVTRHAQGFGTPIGKLKGKVKHAVDLTEKDLKSISELEFESGVKVSGKFKSLLKNSKGKTLIVTFTSLYILNSESQCNGNKSRDVQSDNLRNTHLIVQYGHRSIKSTTIPNSSYLRARKVRRSFINLSSFFKKLAMN